ncbi:hypothetical protein D3C81_2158180 [compost metagenome]
MRRIAVDIRDHDNYIAWTQLWVGAETREQLIVKYLYFSLCAMSYVKTDGFICMKIYSSPAFAGLVQGT